jgi:hypothetical protein
VAVPVLNGRRTMPGCPEALVRQSLRPWAIYVVDNGCTDGTYDWLQGVCRRGTIGTRIAGSSAGPRGRPKRRNPGSDNRGRTGVHRVHRRRLRRRVAPAATPSGRVRPGSSGWWIRYASGAVVDHIHWERTAGDLLRLAAKYGCGRPRILARHFSGQISVWGFGRRVRVHGPVTASVLLSSPEKVVGALCAVALSRPWALGLAVLYAAYLGVRIWSAGRRRAVRGLRLWEVPAMVALQVAEAAVGNGQAFRVGLRGRVLCL